MLDVIAWADVFGRCARFALLVCGWACGVLGVRRLADGVIGSTADLVLLVQVRVLVGQLAFGFGSDWSCDVWTWLLV